MRFAVIADTHFYAAGHGRDGVWWNRPLSSRSLEVGSCLVEALREYPFEFRLVERAEDAAGPVLRVTTHGLREARYAEASFVPEWNNRWVAGTAADRSFDISL